MNVYVNGADLGRSRWYGPKRYVHEILSAMAHLAPEHTFHVHHGLAAPAGDPGTRSLGDLESLGNVRSHGARGRTHFHASIPWRIVRTRSDVYYRMSCATGAHFPVTCPVAALIHDCYRWQLPEAYGVPDGPAEIKKVRERLRRCGAIVAVSEVTRNDLIDMFDVDPARVVVARCSAHLADPAANALLARPAYLPPDVPYFLMVNPGRGNKNWQDVIAGFARYLAAPGADRQTRLVLAGSLNEQEPTIRREVEDAPALAGRVCLPGYVSDDDLNYLFANATLAVAPSFWEGFGVPAVEAMAHGTPTIVSDIPIYHEVAADAALYVPLRDPDALAGAFERLSADAELRGRLIARGKSQIRRHSWDRSARITLDVLARVADGRSPAAAEPTPAGAGPTPPHTSPAAPKS